MAGGRWTTQNKVRPGVYENFVSEAKPLGAVGERGIVTMALPLSWGASKAIIPIEAGENTYDKLGYDITDPRMLLIREALKRAKKLLLYRLNTGTKASAKSDTLTVTAKHGGERGNDITVVIEKNIDENTKFNVATLVGGKEVDVQSKIAAVADLKENAWVQFSGTGNLAASAGLPLTGGTDGAVTNADHSEYLAAAEIEDFNTMALVSTENTLKGIYASYCRRLREQEGKSIQVVVENYPAADDEGVISVKNGVILSDGTNLTAAQAAAWVAGATAGAKINQSLTYTAYDGAIDVSPRYSNTQIIAAIKAGEFVFTHSDGKAIVEKDINSLTGFTPEKGESFASNRVMRILDGINQDFADIFSKFYLGKVDNNQDGRNLLKNECVKYLETLQGINAIQEFDSKTDIVIKQGEQHEGVYIEAHVWPVEAIEKIYVKVVVK